MAVGPPTARRLRGRGHPAARGLRHAAAHHRAPLPAFGAPAPERRHRGMGAGTRRARALAGLRTRCRASVRRPCRHPSPLRAAGMARYVLRLARAGDLRRGARALGLAPPPRAPDVLRRGHADVVAGGPWALLRQYQGALPLRLVRAFLASRVAARTDSATRLRLLHGRAAVVGPLGSCRPADRGSHHGGRAGNRLLRGLCVLLHALPPHRAHCGRLQRKPEMSAPPATTSVAATISLAPIRSLRRSTSIEIKTANSDSVATSGATTVTRPRSKAE